MIIKFNGLTLKEIQSLIKQGKIYDLHSDYQWFGNLNMFLNRFHSLMIENEDGETCEPIRAEWDNEDLEEKDRIEEIDEHIMLDNFDCGYGFFGSSFTI